MELLELFESYITGNFSNRDQVEEEEKNGGQIHPLSWHVNRRIDHLIENLPVISGFFILEESYYKMKGEKTIKPHIFCFQKDEFDNVVLTSYKNPDRFELDQLTNDNENLFLDYNELEISQFKPLTYEYREGIGFVGESISDFGDNRIFRLAETIGENTLLVMEELKVNGKIVTPYRTPIRYRREQNA